MTETLRKQIDCVEMFWVFLFAVMVFALLDWWAVWAGRSRVEAVAKPAVMLALIGTALVIDASPEIARWFVIAALAFGLVGDVMLLPAVDRFLHGLGAFLVGHGLYIAAFATMELAFIGIVGGLTAAAVLLLYLGWPTVKQVWGGALGIPVSAYMVVIAAMVTVGTATHRWPIAAGGVLFAISDGLLGLDRFVRAAPNRRVVVHILYHLGQAGFVLGLSWAG